MKPQNGLIKFITEFESVDSTNKKAKELLLKIDLKEGTFILAHDQFAGKGYGKNGWESERNKNITGSLILKPYFLEPHKQFLLTKVLSLAIKDAVEKYIGTQHKVSVKWPNDIYVNDKKIAGILVENTILGNTIQNSICGIGINVNQEFFLSDAPNPVSLKLMAHTDFDLAEVITTVSQALQNWYDLLKTERLGIINQAYYLSLYRLNISARFKTQSFEFTGQIKGTDDYGRLLIDDSKGLLQAFDFKEVVFIQDA